MSLSPFALLPPPDSVYTFACSLYLKSVNQSVFLKNDHPYFLLGILLLTAKIYKLIDLIASVRGYHKLQPVDQIWPATSFCK